MVSGLVDGENCFVWILLVLGICINYSVDIVIVIVEMVLVVNNDILEIGKDFRIESINL